MLLLAAILAATIVSVATTDLFDPQPRMSMPPKNAPHLDSTQPIAVRVADLLSYMTLEEKIGQMALVEKNSIKSTDHVRTYALGALLSGSGAKPEQNTVAGWQTMVEEYQSQAAQSRLGIPLLYGSDAIHGHAHVPGATVFPHMIGLGAAADPELVRAVARATAEELNATGVNWNFAPNLDTPQDIRWGRTYEAFSDDPALVATLGAAYVQGLQASTNVSDGDLRVLATAKHFVGLGGMGWRTSLNENFSIDQGVTAPDGSMLRNVYLPPFAEAIQAGALCVMVGLNTWGDTRTVRQRSMLRDVLKKDLGFTGFVVSDWYGVHEGVRSIFLATVTAINAGVDMVMLPFDYETFIRHVKWANRLGLISDERIDDAVRRILYAKFALGLFDVNGGMAERIMIPNTTHRALAREAVARSLVLLKNEEQILPLGDATKTLYVAGSGADNVGRQMGAWSIEWQGVDGNWPPGTASILAGIMDRARAQGAEVVYDRLGNFPPKERMADVGIAVVSERPYAEGWGDTEYPTLSEEDLNAITHLRAISKKLIVVIVSGRPLLIEKEVGSFDALVAAWLPGSEGAGVADVLFGDVPFTGTLSLPWPARSEQLPIHPDGTTSDGTSVLFPRHFGITTD